jgi:hypothetical protein
MQTPIKKLKGHQKKIDPAMLRKVLQGKARGDKFEPVAVHKNTVVDGAHRVAADRAIGKKTTKTKKATKNDMLKALKKKAKVAKGGSVGKENG